MGQERRTATRPCWAQFWQKRSAAGIAAGCNPALLATILTADSEVLCSCRWISAARCLQFCSLVQAGSLFRVEGAVLIYVSQQAPFPCDNCYTLLYKVQ